MNYTILYRFREQLLHIFIIQILHFYNNLPKFSMFFTQPYVFGSILRNHAFFAFLPFFQSFSQRKTFHFINFSV